MENNEPKLTAINLSRDEQKTVELVDCINEFIESNFLGQTPEFTANEVSDILLNAVILVLSELGGGFDNEKKTNRKRIAIRRT